ncbi:hypothetical protein AVEN_97874-1 [Araneus ventricosus]|uniref:Uncharacterized protein n=1 Tax=Araneus ventricosus TaxID=182803 RepID=A0A4Y2F2A2_ARAVE|nr:hypothetical protein AVEN_97874-1 [Araneus ventricosus]
MSLDLDALVRHVLRAEDVDDVSKDKVKTDRNPELTENTSEDSQKNFEALDELEKDVSHIPIGCLPILQPLLPDETRHNFPLVATMDDSERPESSNDNKSVGSEETGEYTDEDSLISSDNSVRSTDASEIETDFDDQVTNIMEKNEELSSDDSAVERPGKRRKTE